MSLKTAILLAGFSAVVGIAFGYFLRWIISLGKKGSVELEIKQMILEAKDEAQKIVTEAEDKTKEAQEELRVETRQKQGEAKKTEDRLVKKEEFLDSRQRDIDREAEELKGKIVEVKTIKEKVEKMEQDKISEFEKIAQLTSKEAKAELLKAVEGDNAEDIAVRMQKLDVQGEERLEKKAQEILALSIQRLANSVASDSMSTIVPIPSDDLKGKIIGKEGRNIKAFERSTGVEVIVDDSPGAITISSFDPVRRQVAKTALLSLIKDGRIQPARIEEITEKSKLEINKVIKEKGDAAVFECGVYNLDPRIISILGRLHFRTSYGQNVLQHSIEMAHIAGMIAEEIGADVPVAKAGALLHDIGKALDHEVSGTHVEIGRRILQKFGAKEEIIRAMEAHHEEYPYSTIESRIVQTADAISGARPGARRDSVENYLKRLEELEAVAKGFDGVDKAYALQAGREIRIFISPNAVNDLEARKMARDIALRIESELKYPGEIKVNVIRETRSIEYAR
jgi:ribonucrease Y